MDTEQLFLDLQCNRLMELRYIYAPDYIENGFRVGLGMNSFKANCMTIQIQPEGSYNICLFKNRKPKFNNVTKLFDPPTKQLLFKNTFDNIEDVKQFLYNLLERRYTTLS